jgi:hypothetical protein
MQHPVASATPSTSAPGGGSDGVGDPATSGEVCVSMAASTVTTTISYSHPGSSGTFTSSQAFPAPPGWPQGGFLPHWPAYPPGYFPYPYPQGQDMGKPTSMGQEHFVPPPFYGGFVPPYPYRLPDGSGQGGNSGHTVPKPHPQGVTGPSFLDMGPPQHPAPS